MNKPLAIGLALIVAALAGAVYANAGQGVPQAAKNIQPVSWDGWLAAKVMAEKRDADGDFVTALQYYLEYIRQAQGLNSPVRVAWGKNNAAYMIIKMHRLDPTVDLNPAKKMLEEGLAVAEASDECRTRLSMNLEYVRSFLGRSD